MTKGTLHSIDCLIAQHRASASLTLGHCVKAVVYMAATKLWKSAILQFAA